MEKEIMSKNLSIITLSKNNHKQLKKTIESTFCLRENGTKQIVIDSSSKETFKKNKIYVSNKKNCLIFYQKPSGISSGFNYGISKVKKGWIWILNSGDDSIIDLKTKPFLEILLSKTKAGAILFEILIENKRYVRPPFFSLWPPNFNWIPHPGSIINKKTYDKVGNYDKKYKIAMDGEFWFRLLGSDKLTIDMISFPIANFKLDGTSSKNLKLKNKEILRINFKYLPLIIKRFLNQVLLFIRVSIQNIKLFL
ncbi:MAG: hypothetical protein HOC16_01065 [Candidatus Pacebacteria bacterium]|nr:hypothetical protein [Candidatus Paceibacterota bacterium]